MASDIPGVSFARTDGAQLFVRANSVEHVLAEITTYVDLHRCSGMFEAVDDRIEGLEERRNQREFALAPPKTGWITVWEDGVLGDRRLARHLSAQLRTSVRWLMVSSSTDSWALFSYENGEQGNVILQQEVDVVAKARAAARQEHLPYALWYLPDPNLGTYLAQLDVPALKELGIDITAAVSSLPRGSEPEGLVRQALPCARHDQSRFRGSDTN
jgi:hypothetical protein